MEQPGQIPLDPVQALGGSPADAASQASPVGVLPDVQSPESGETPSSGRTPRVSLETQPTVITKSPLAGASSSATSRTRRPSLSVLEFGRSLIGKTLDHFELREFIGGGGMGAVFRGIDTRLGRSVAVKVLSRDQHDPETRKRFKNEAQNAARLDHDNIARVYYVGEADGSSYIVFEFIEGVNIRDLVEERGPLPVAEAISYTIQLAEALTHASSRDVVHRDIKPSNVLITPQGKAKLVDMGLARLHHLQAGEEDLTASGVTLGTFDYISPEQARDPRSADVRSDLYSLGCTLFYVLTARPPFPEGTVLQKLISHSSETPPDVRSLRPDMPEELGKIVERMLAKEPARRHQTPQALIDDLWRCAEANDLAVPYLATATRPAHADAPPPWWVAHLPWLAPLAALLLMAAFSEWLFPPREAGGMPAPRFNVPTALRPATVDAPRAEAPIPSAIPTPEKPVVGPPAVPVEPGPARPDPMARPLPPIDPVEPGPIGPEPLPREMNLAALPLPGEVEFPMPADVDPAPVPAPVPRDPVLPPEENPAAPASALSAIAGLLPATVARLPLAPALPAPAAERLIVVGTLAKDEKAIAAPDLAAAVAQAAREIPGLPVVIELRYDGLRRSAPLRLVNQSLQIRGGRGFSPTILFAPEEAKSMQIPKAMVQMVNGKLELRDLAVIFAVPQQPSETWALFEIQDADLVYVFNCSLTVENAYEGRSAWHSDVAIFDLLPPAAPPPLMKPEEMMAKAEVSVPIELWHTVARGEATLVRARESIPFRLDWTNGLFASSERMISLGGAASAPQLGGRIDLSLTHVTAAMDKGLLSAQAHGAARHLLPVVAQFKDSIFLAGPDHPLIEQRGLEDVESVRKKMLRVTGDGNHYQGGFAGPLELFWRITSVGPRPETVDLNFEDWGKQWPEEMMPQRRLVKWVAPPPAELAAHKQTKADYSLSPERNNPARATAPDDTDAGFEPALLPDPPTGRPLSSEPSPLPAPPTGLRPTVTK